MLSKFWYDAKSIGSQKMYLECGLNEHLFQDSLKHFYGQKEKVSLDRNQTQ